MIGIDDRHVLTDQGEGDSVRLIVRVKSRPEQSKEWVR